MEPELPPPSELKGRRTNHPPTSPINSAAAQEVAALLLLRKNFNALSAGLCGCDHWKEKDLKRRDLTVYKTTAELLRSCQPARFLTWRRIFMRGETPVLSKIFKITHRASQACRVFSSESHFSSLGVEFFHRSIISILCCHIKQNASTRFIIGIFPGDMSIWSRCRSTRGIACDTREAFEEFLRGEGCKAKS